MKDWAVVHFLEDESVEAVPAHWFNIEEKLCLWPPKTSNKIIAELIKKREEPNEGWQTFSAKLLGTYDFYQEAKRKAAKAQHYSDLSSAPESITLTKTRKRKCQREKQKIRYSPDTKLVEKSDSDSESLDSSEIQINVPAKKRINYNYNKENTSNFDGYISIAETSSQPVPSGSNSNNNETENKEFQRQVLTQLNIISLKINEQGEILNLILRDKNATNSVIFDNSTVNLENMLSLLPLNHLSSLGEMEDLLKDVANHNALIRELSRLGGGDAKTLAKRIMYRTFTNEVGQLFSWDGAKGKKVFKSLNIAQVVLRAVRINPRTQGEDEDITILAIKSWLVRAKDRLILKQRRESRKDSSNFSTAENDAANPGALQFE